MPEPVAKRRHTEESLIAALRKRYPARSHALFHHVPDSVGFEKRRTADAVVVGLWPSQGMECHGFELKVSRGDWLRELKDPSKAESVARFCNRWWVVVGDAKIVKDGELPKGWGLLAATAETLRVVVEAPELPAGREPWPRSFIASLLRCATETAASLPEAAIRAEIDRRWAASRAAEAECRERDLANTQKELEALKAQVAAFERASGLSLGGPWTDGQALGALVAECRRSGVDFQRRQVEGLRGHLARLAAGVEEALLQLAPREEPGDFGPLQPEHPDCKNAKTSGDLDNCCDRCEGRP